VASDFGSVSVDELLDELSQETAVPGAGPAAALACASAAALVGMVARLSRETWAEAGATAAQADALRVRSVELAREDADAVEAFLAARAPGADDQKQKTRDFELGVTLDRAAEVPLAIAETACDVALLAAHVVGRCRGDVRADAAAAAQLALGAARAAAHLVEVNLATGPSDDRVARARGIVRTTGAAADDVVKML